MVNLTRPVSLGAAIIVFSFCAAAAMSAPPLPLEPETATWTAAARGVEADSDEELLADDIDGGAAVNDTVLTGGGYTMVVMALDWGGGVATGGGYSFAFNAVQGNIAPCPADFNGDGQASVQDIYDFLEAFRTGDGAADFDGQDGPTVQDVYAFLGAWQKGCETQQPDAPVP